MFPIESMYWWQGQIVEDEEVVLVAKTRRERFEAVREYIKEVHSYEVPAIICLPTAEVDERYLAWLQSETESRANTKGQST
jgi:periplasmic divalent cation tolerance protein